MASQLADQGWEADRHMPDWPGGQPGAGQGRVRVRRASGRDRHLTLSDESVGSPAGAVQLIWPTHLAE